MSTIIQSGSLGLRLDTKLVKDMGCCNCDHYGTCLKLTITDSIYYLYICKDCLVNFFDDDPKDE